MIDDKTKNNHYVPRYYLKNFWNENKNLFQLYLPNKKIEMIHDENGLKGICRGKNLYTVKTEITDNDISIYKKIFLPDYEVPDYYIFLLKNYLNDTLGNLYNISTPDETINEYLKTIHLKKNFNTESRTQENIFTYIYENNDLYKIIIENKILPTMQKNKEASFLEYSWLKISQFIYLSLQSKIYNNLDNKDKIEKPQKINTINDDNFYDLIIFIFLQYFRTKKIKIAMINCLNKLIENKEFCENLFFLFLHINPILIANTCIKENYKFVLIKNYSNIDFITSDYPCINFYNFCIKNRELSDDELEIYFPLSPKIALLFTKRECYNKTNLITLSKPDDIEKYNNAIINEADTCVYSNSKYILEQYKQKKCN